MTTLRLSSLLLLLVLMNTLTSCAAIGDIFKTGVWVGVIGVVFVVAIIWWIVSKMSGGGGTPS